MTARIDASLLARYDVPTPRYTSYPTALSFQTLGAPLPPSVEDAAGPLSLYFHLPFCRNLCWYCACTRVITKQQNRSGSYLDRLLREFEMRMSWLEGRPVEQLHLGGGTPTFLLAEELEAMARYIGERLAFAPDADVSVEIDPRELTDDQIVALAGGGFNRASLGVQDHDDKVQAAIRRIQPYEMTESAVRRLREAGFSSINFDLVYGLPEQTVESFQRTIDDVVALSPDRLAVYSYAHVPSVAPAQKLLERRYDIPGAETKIAMFIAAAKALQDAGYVHIGMDHFAKPEDSLHTALREQTLRRNFMGYTTHRGIDIHAFGMSAISQTRDTYFQNDRELSNWERAIDEQRSPVVKGYVLDEDDKLRRDVIMGIMCSARIEFAEIGAAHGIDFRTYFADELAQMTDLAADGLVEIDGDSLAVTPLGRFLVRNVASAFDAHRRSHTGFSRAI